MIRSLESNLSISLSFLLYIIISKPNSSFWSIGTQSIIKRRDHSARRGMLQLAVSVKRLIYMPQPLSDLQMHHRWGCLVLGSPREGFFCPAKPQERVLSPSRAILATICIDYDFRGVSAKLITFLRRFSYMNWCFVMWLVFGLWFSVFSPLSFYLLAKIAILKMCFRLRWCWVESTADYFQRCCKFIAQGECYSRWRCWSSLPWVILLQICSGWWCVGAWLLFSNWLVLHLFC